MARRAAAAVKFLPLMLTALTVVFIYARICISLALQEAHARWKPLHADSGGLDKVKIPKIIHQMYGVDDLPARWSSIPATWQQMHPDYEYKLWTDTTLRHLIVRSHCTYGMHTNKLTEHAQANAYPWLLDTYDSYPHDTQRWDSSRYAILHKYPQPMPSCCQPLLPPHKLVPPP